MARAKKRSASAAAPEPEAASTLVAPSRGHWSEGLSWLGWTAVALGLVTGVATEGHVSFAGFALAAHGVLAGLIGMTVSARRPRTGPLVWPLSALGTLLLLGGALGLVYPCFVTRARAVELHEAAPWGPVLAVCLVLAGLALLIFALQREGSTEPPFSEDEEARYASWGSRVLLIVSPYHLVVFLWRTWRELDREAAREREARAAAGQNGYDWAPILVFTVGAVCLALMEYFGHATTMREIVDHFDPPGRMGEAEGFFATVRESPFRRLTDFVWWSGWRVLGFFLIPAIVVKLVLRERLADYGLATAGFLKHAWIYVLFFVPVLAAVVVVSYEESFKTYYPFYRDASRSWFDFWAWELLYAAQFFSLEFFFRGFWLKAAKRSMGSHAIYAMVVPYCMIHFGKPFLETLAAVLAGIILGTLALRTRSIWSGFLIHVSVAISMDLAALAQTSGWPDRWWPAL